jgi:hypothetical protein
MSTIKANNLNTYTGSTLTVDAATLSANTINATAVNVNGVPVAAPLIPTIGSISPNTIPNTSTAITIAGTNFQSIPTVLAIGSNGIIVQADSVSFSSSVSISATFTLTVDQTYYIRVTNPDGYAGQSGTPILTVSDEPVWVTGSGTLGSFGAGAAISVTVEATSDSTVAYSQVSGSLPGGLTLNTSTGVISGTETGASATTTYTFVLRATDAETQSPADRTFSITIIVGVFEGMQFN